METAIIKSFQQSAHLSALVSLLAAKYQPLLIYQFAVVQQSEQFQSLFATAMVEEAETQFLLVVTASNKRLEHELQDFASRHFTAGKVVVFSHGERTLKYCLEQGNYFFNLTVNRATLLYSADCFLNSNKVAAVKPERNLAEVQLHWQNRVKMARGFLIAAEKSLEEGHDRVLMFLLHQVIEQVCIGLIWVFMGYKSDIHNLKRLLQICTCFSKLPQRQICHSLCKVMGRPVMTSILNWMVLLYTDY